MRLAIANSKIKKRNLVLINNVTYERETLSERPIRHEFVFFHVMGHCKIRQNSANLFTTILFVLL